MTRARLGDVVSPGQLVAVADGAGAPVGILEELCALAGSVEGLRLLLGWSLELPDAVDFGPFADVRTVMGGYALRRHIASGEVTYVPVRLGTIPALLHSTLRPDVLAVSVVPGPDGWRLGSEVGWVRAAIAAGARVVAEVNHALPAADSGPPLDPDRVVVVGEVERPPHELPPPTTDDALEAIGRHVAKLVPEGASIQFGPGGVANAIIRNLEVPVRVDSGVLTDDVLELADRGLLLGPATATYLAGTSALYRWADGAGVLTGIEHTHDISRLAGLPFFALNTALQIDVTGQVNVEAIGSQPLAGIGGHADYAHAASRAPGGLSIIALPTLRGGRPTLVEELPAAVSTPRSDVDVVVNEHGVADLRGLGDRERRRVLVELWGGEVGSTTADAG